MSTTNHNLKTMTHTAVNSLMRFTITKQQTISFPWLLLKITNTSHYKQLTAHFSNDCSVAFPIEKHGKSIEQEQQYFRNDNEVLDRQFFYFTGPSTQKTWTRCPQDSKRRLISKTPLSSKMTFRFQTSDGRLQDSNFLCPANLYITKRWCHRNVNLPLPGNITWISILEII